MRISTNQIHQQSVTAMLDQQTKLAQTQQQVSTGEKLQSPSDDPVAAVKALGLDREINLTDQYQDNADVAENKLTNTDGILSSATNILQRIRELVIQGLNDTNAETRSGIAEEISQLNETLVGLANSTDSNGEYIFSGYQSDTQAFDPNTYTYNGDSGQRSVRVGSGYLVEVNEPGDAVFVATHVSGATTTTQAVFQTIDDFVTALNGGTVGTAPNNGDVLTNISSAMDNILAARTRIGSRLNAVDHQRSINEATKASMQTNLSQLKDLDYAEAVSRLTRQSTGLQAAQQAYVKVQGLSLFNYL